MWLRIYYLISIPCLKVFQIHETVVLMYTIASFVCLFTAEFSLKAQYKIDENHTTDSV